MLGRIALNNARRHFRHICNPNRRSIESVFFLHLYLVTSRSQRFGLFEQFLIHV